MTDLLDAIYTLRSIRHFLPDPVPDEVIAALIEAATRAPSGRNAQGWRFIAITDPATRRKVGDLYKEAWDEYSPPSRLAAITEPRERRRVASAYHLGATMGTEPPLLIVVCGERMPSDGSLAARTHTASIYPAVQNLLLAARAHGLGGCLTTIHMFREAQVKEVLGIPDDVDTYALIPLGRPAEAFGRLRRKPVADVAFRDRWGTRLEASPTARA